MNSLRGKIFYLTLLAGLAPWFSVAEAKSASKKQKAKTSAKASKRSKTSATSNIDRDFARIKNSYRQGEKNSDVLWDKLLDIEQQSSALSDTNRNLLLQIQANMLAAGGYPILASLYAVEAIQSAKEPSSKLLTPAWILLWRSSKEHSLQNVVQRLAANLEIKEAPPGFDSEWFYHRGNANLALGKFDAAMADYKRLRINDRYFLSAKYQVGITHLLKENFDEAEVALKSMLNSVSQTLAPLSSEELDNLRNYAKLGLARLYYQKREFKNAIKFYRSVDRESPLFYDSLFEQSWAFFMAGYPNHALGALHGVDSPFFANITNPEAPVLRAITYYWMCRYEDSKAALADFAEKHSEAVESLSEFLDRKRLSAKTAYQLFENYVSGVSESSLGIPKSVLEVASNDDYMLLLRNQYAAVVEELDNVERSGIYRNRNNVKATKLLRRQIDDLQEQIGKQLITELSDLKDQFERLYEQSQFLYVELLMSEKEQLLGRELHASSKLDRVSRRQEIVGWGRDNQEWADSRLNEYWLDEIGFHIYRLEPMCRTK